MRNPTEKERESVNEYVESISMPTGLNFYDLIYDELYTVGASDCNRWGMWHGCSLDCPVFRSRKCEIQEVIEEEYGEE